MQHMGGEGGEVHTGFWWDNLQDRDHLEDQDGNVKLNIQELG